jgi:hypothetical protein
VAGLLRGVRPIGDWSTLITLSNSIQPFDAPCGATSAWLPYSLRATAAYSVSLTSVLLPEPDTPVTQVSSPTGKADVHALQVVAVAPTMDAGSASRWAACARRGTAMRSTPLR